MALLVCLLTVLLEFLLYRLGLWTVRAHPTDDGAPSSVGRAALQQGPRVRHARALAACARPLQPVRECGRTPGTPASMRWLDATPVGESHRGRGTYKICVRPVESPLGPSNRQPGTVQSSALRRSSAAGVITYLGSARGLCSAALCCGEY